MEAGGGGGAAAPPGARTSGGLELHALGDRLLILVGRGADLEQVDLLDDRAVPVLGTDAVIDLGHRVQQRGDDPEPLLLGPDLGEVGRVVLRERGGGEQDPGLGGDDDAGAVVEVEWLEDLVDLVDEFGIDDRVIDQGRGDLDLVHALGIFAAPLAEPILDLGGPLQEGLLDGEQPAPGRVDVLDERVLLGGGEGLILVIDEAAAGVFADLGLRPGDLLLALQGLGIDRVVAEEEADDGQDDRDADGDPEAILDARLEERLELVHVRVALIGRGGVPGVEFKRPATERSGRRADEGR